MADVLTMLSIIFLFVFPLATMGIWTAHKAKMATLNKEVHNSDKQKYENEIIAMKKRIEVLEAIVTDKKYQLDKEIADLHVINN